MDSLISFNMFINGIISLMACDIAIYSASVVLNDISDCSFDDHADGQLACFITYPVLDNTEVGSLLQNLLRSPANDASTYTSRL
eukprot:8682985-Ditylum_brightwellii.AAC.1